MENSKQPASNTRRSIVRPRHRWMFSVGGWLLAVPKFILLFAVRGYQLTLSPALTFLFGPAFGCRFTPTCSQYAIDAIRERGAVAGIILSARRIGRCHPWGGCGHDPVPKTKFSIQSSKFKI